MATEIRYRRGTTAEHSVFTGAPGEMTIDTDKNAVVVHDGVTQGGFPTPTDIGTLRDVDATTSQNGDSFLFNGSIYVPASSHTGSMNIPSGTSAQRPVTPTFSIRWNTEGEFYEGWNGTAWVPINVNQSELQWNSKPIAEPFPLLDHYAGASVPPTANPAFRYIKLTAGESGVGGYNEGVLINETVSGTAPLIAATAEINLPESPLHGQTVNLINTERRVIRAGESGSLQDDAFQGHMIGESNSGPLQLSTVGNGLDRSSVRTLDGSVLKIISDGVNGEPRIASETRSRNIGATYYVRIL